VPNLDAGPEGAQIKREGQAMAKSELRRQPRYDAYDLSKQGVSNASVEARREVECDCQEGMFPNKSRRGFIRGMITAAGAGAASAIAGGAHAHTEDLPVPDDSTKELGAGIIDGGYGVRSQFETVGRARLNLLKNPEATASMTPLAEGMGIITPSGLHFERHHGGIPTIDPARHSLIVHGMVNKAKKYSLADLKKFPAISRTLFIECSGNTFTEFKGAFQKNVQDTHGLTSTSEWTGVPLSTILREVGLEEGAAWILAEGADAAVMTRSVPIDKCWKDAMLAYGQNGEAIRPEQGYPLRLILPGWEGNTHIKWLRRLEISDKPFMTRQETSKYTDILKGGKARQFTFTMDAKSVITFPSGEMKLPGPGYYEITGLAWTGRGKIKRVEVSTDGGKIWQMAELQQPVLSLAHTRFRFPWIWDGRATVIQSRCQDETGYTQPTIEQIEAARGSVGHPKFASFYHNNSIQSWGIETDGSVVNANRKA
jgi:sulfane dehydrogenase subunit SoxC